MKNQSIMCYIKAQAAVESLLKDKRLVTLLMILFLNMNLAMAQGNSSDMTSGLWAQAPRLYKFLSVVVFLAAIFYACKAIVEGLRGEQGAWLKLGAVAALTAIWIWGVPALINYFATAGTSNATFDTIK